MVCGSELQSVGPSHRINRVASVKGHHLHYKIALDPRHTSEPVSITLILVHSILSKQLQYTPILLPIND